MPRLPEFASSKPGSTIRPSISKRVARLGSAEPAGSILITPAPEEASTAPQAGAITHELSSTTRMPASGPPARGSSTGRSPAVRSPVISRYSSWNSGSRFSTKARVPSRESLEAFATRLYSW